MYRQPGFQVFAPPIYTKQTRLLKRSILQTSFQITAGLFEINSWDMQIQVNTLVFSSLINLLVWYSTHSKPRCWPIPKISLNLLLSELKNRTQLAKWGSQFYSSITFLTMPCICTIVRNDFISFSSSAWMKVFY